MFQAFCTNYGNWRPKALRHVSSNLLDPALIQSLPDSDDFTKVLSMNGVLVSIAAAYLCLNYLFQNFTKCTLASTITPLMHTYIVSTQLHGFSDASECAYACVVYLHMLGSVYSSLVISKMKVTHIKRLTVPWLELCGTCLLAELLYIVRDVL